LFYIKGIIITQVANDTCTSCSETVFTFNKTYACGDIRDSNTFKFNATDTEENDDETLTTDTDDYLGDDNTFNIEQDDVTINLTSGNNTNATLGNPAFLAVQVYDTDNGTSILESTATLTYNVTLYGIGGNFTIVGTADTDSTGQANFSFLPNQTFTRAIQEWKAYTEPQTCYNFNESIVFNVTVFTNKPQQDNESVAPQSGGWGIERFFSVIVNDTHDNATIVLFEDSAITGPFTTELARQNYIFEEDVNKVLNDASQTSDSSFNFTEEINFSVHNVTVFNITINNVDLTGNFTFNLTVNEVSIATNINATNGTNTTIDVLRNISMTFPGNNTINLTTSSSITGAAADANYTAYLYYRLEGVVRTLNFSVNITRGHALGTFFFKFNGSNTVGNGNATDVITKNNFTVTEDTLEFRNITGNHSVANRSNDLRAPLSVVVFDTDNGTFVGNLNVTFSVTTDGASFDSGFKNTTNGSGFVQYNFDPGCSAPLYQAQNQTWKLDIADEDKYFDLSRLGLNITIQGDIRLAFTLPDGTVNFTQEDLVAFQGATTDDCDSALVTTVIYRANTTEDFGFQCDNTTQLGANAFTCNFETNLTTTKGWYNTTMFANATFHRDNFTFNNGSVFPEGLFFVFPKKKLDTPIGSPSGGGWGRNDWNFSVIASSGDVDANLNVTLFMDKATPNPTTKCSEPTCVNQSSVVCDNCLDQTVYWNRTFTSDDIGEWFFQFQFNDSALTETSGTDFSVDVDKDLTNITFIAGNKSTVVYLVEPVNLTVQIFDKDRNTSELEPRAVVTFKLLHTSYPNGEKTIGSNRTNASGHARFLFNLTECPDNVFSGVQNWTAEINTSEVHYNQSVSENFTITLDTTGCEASTQVQAVSRPDDTFQFRLFVVNTSIRALTETANDVNVTLKAPDIWVIRNRSQFIGSVDVGSPVAVSWTINATTFGRFNVTVEANSSNAANSSLVSSHFIVYKEIPKINSRTPTLSFILNASQNLTTSWTCAPGQYRIATINISIDQLSSLSTIRPISNETSTGAFGYILNLENASDGSLNDTLSNATITSNGTGINNFSHVNLTFQMNTSLESTTIFMVTARNITDLAGSISFFNFSSGGFEFFLRPTSADVQFNQTVINKDSDLINATGHLIVFVNSTANGSNSSTIYLNDIYISSSTGLGGTTMRVLTYDGGKFIDILHSRSIATDNGVESVVVPVLQNQLNANESGFCVVKIRNIGLNSLNITDLVLETYYNETVIIQDIITTIGKANTSGIEPTEEAFNLTIKIANSVNLTYRINVTINITNSTDETKNFTTHTNINITANATYYENFLNVNTTTWNPDDYTIRVKVEGNFSATRGPALTTRNEPFIFKYVNVTSSSVKYICNRTTETYTVNIVHPFTDTIEYNVSLILSQGWNYSGHQIITATSIGIYSTDFNITASTSDTANVTINASVNFTYPSNISKEIQAVVSLEEGQAFPILEVIRETPKSVANRTEFVSRIIVHNKGCADATSITVKEVISTGWTAFAPSIDGTSAGVADITDGEIRFSSSDIGTIKAPDYKVLAYSVLSPSAQLDTGTFNFNVTWGERKNIEAVSHEVETTRFIKEEHLEFNIIADESFNTRSAESLENQTYNFTITNRGDIDIKNGTWNVTLTIPETCTVSNFTGTFLEVEKKLAWDLTALTIANTTTLNFKMNCTGNSRYILTAEGKKNNISFVSNSNTTSISCSAATCSNSQTFAFTKPSDPRYEKLSQINFSIKYNWTGVNVTIGQGSVTLTNDSGASNLVWQEYSFTNVSNTIWANYSIDDGDLVE